MNELPPHLQDLTNTYAPVQRAALGEMLRELDDPDRLIQLCEKLEEKGVNDIWEQAACTSPAALTGDALKLLLERGDQASEQLLNNRHLNQESVDRLVECLYELTSSPSPEKYFTQLRKRGWTVPISVVRALREEILQDPGGAAGWQWVAVLGEPGLESDELLELWQALVARVEENRKKQHTATYGRLSGTDIELFVAHPAAGDNLFSSVLEYVDNNDEIPENMVEQAIFKIIRSYHHGRDSAVVWEQALQAARGDNLDEMIHQATGEDLGGLIQRVIQEGSSRAVLQRLKRLHREEKEKGRSPALLERLPAHAFQHLLRIEDPEVRQEFIRLAGHREGRDEVAPSDRQGRTR